MTKRPPTNKTRRRGRTPHYPRLLGGRHCLDFANTIEAPISSNPEDFIRDYGDLVRWSWHTGALDEAEAENLHQVAASKATEAADVVEHALGLREAIDRVFRAIAAGAQAPDADLVALRDAYLEALHAASLTPVGGRLAWTWRDVEDLRRPIWLVVGSAVQLLTEGDLARVRQCPGAGDCGWLFYDTSRNRTRRWCSMDGCGSRVKMRRQYAKHRSG